MGAFEDQSGKVSAKIFKEDLLDQCGAIREEVVIGPQFGVDTSIIDLKNGQALAVSSDPLSLIPSLGLEVSAWLSVHLLVNDMVTTGFAPQYAQFVLNLPTSLSRTDFQTYWGHIHALCSKLDIAITGGHTGQIPGQESTIAGGGTMFLQAPKEEILSSNRAQAGDSIIVTKTAAITSSSLLAMAFPETVQNKAGTEVHQKATENFWKLSALQDGLTASKVLRSNDELHGMHDVTEGGILGAVSEMSIASGLGFSIDYQSLPIAHEISEVMNLFEIDPFISVGAGSMIMAVKNGCEEKLMQELTKSGISATVVGRFSAGNTRELIMEDGTSPSFDFDGVDPYWGAFFNALNAGWK